MPYAFLIMAVITGCLAVCGIGPSFWFAIASGGFVLAFVATTLRTFGKFGI